MSQTLECDVLVVGGGPGGYPAAIRAGQLGLKTLLVDAEGLGGTCLLRGCIPSKAFIHAASEFQSVASAATEDNPYGISIKSAPDLDFKKLAGWKNSVVENLTGGVAQLLKAASVKVISGWARFSNAKTCMVEGGDGEFTVKPQHVILANGSSEIELPDIPFDGTHVLSSTHVLELQSLPKSVAIIGAGYIGMELGMALSKFGTDVTFIEAADRILPGYDAELSRPVAQAAKLAGIDILLNAKAKQTRKIDQAVELSFESKAGETNSISVEKVIVAIGRQPRTQDWGLETMGVDMNGPFVQTNDKCQTSMSGVYAIGDLTGEPMLAHKATSQGECAAEIISGAKRRFAPVAIPAVCFTDPEIVSVGQTPDEAKADGEEIVVSKFPLAASGRALSMNTGGSRGFVRVVARKDDHVILGVQAVGPHVSDLSGEFVLALEMGAVLEDIAQTIHAHPTLSEMFAESAMAALGHPIHIAAK